MLVRRFPAPHWRDSGVGHFMMNLVFRSRIEKKSRRIGVPIRFARNHHSKRGTVAQGRRADYQGKKNQLLDMGITGARRGITALTALNRKAIFAASLQTRCIGRINFRKASVNHGDGVGRCRENVSPFTFVLLRKTYT
jgi:hypothetical protein